MESVGSAGAAACRAATHPGLAEFLTSHLGEGALVAIGTDPEGRPDQAWQVVRNIPLLGGGSLFVKSHPNSPWIWVDHTKDIY